MVEDLRIRLEELTKPVIAAMGYEFWGIELHGRGAHTLLRIYVDSEQGVNLDDLSRVSYQLSGLLDVEEPMAHRYTLEVSSPGLNRPLFTLEHYKRFIGSKVRIKLVAHPNSVRRNYIGKIEAISDGKVIIICNDENLEFGIEQIEKARLLNQC